MAVSISQVSLTPRPVLVPACSTSPFRMRALNEVSNPCQ
jgi:hypothetical protein